MHVEPQVALAKIMLARYYGANLGRFLAVDPVNDVQTEKPRSWNKYAYVRNNPLRNIDPTGTEYVDAQGKKLHEDVQADPNMTQTEQQVTQDVDASSLPVETAVVPEAAAKIGAPGQAVSPGDQLGPGELIVVGSPASVDSLTSARATEGSASKIQYEWVMNPVDTSQPGAGMVIFQGSHDLAPPPGAVSLDHAVRTTFVHASVHLEGVGGTGVRPEADVFLRLMGTNSQCPLCQDGVRHSP